MKFSMRRLCRFLLLLAMALAAPCQAAPAAVELTAAVRELDLGAHAERLTDPTARMTLDEIRQLEGWMPLGKARAGGYTAAAVWLRFSVVPGKDAPADWFLSLDNPLLDEVDLYLIDPAGNVTHQRSGEMLPRDQWPVNFRQPSFALNLHVAGVHQAWVRITSRNAMAFSVALRQAPDFLATVKEDVLIHGLLFGGYVLLLVFHVYFWWWTRVPNSGLYLGYASLNSLLVLLNSTYLYYFIPLPPHFSDPLLMLSNCAAIMVGVVFVVRFMSLATVMPRLARLITFVVGCVVALSAFWIATGQADKGAPLTQMVMLILIAFFVSLALYLWLIRKHPPARQFLQFFGIYYIGVVLILLRNQGILPSNLLTIHAYQIGLTLHLMLMSLRITGDYNRIKQEKVAAQAESLAAIRALNASLEQRVAERTHTLQQEVNRREALEIQLRAALESEQEAQRQQQDFVRMVSHELRTPLAVITTTAQRIVQSETTPFEKTQQRCDNILDAAHRLTALVDNYLLTDRLKMDAMLALAPCDLDTLIEEAAMEWPNLNVQVELPQRPLSLTCDAGLVSVALRNLLENAQRHSIPDHPVLLRAEPTADGIRVLVCNAGAPVPDDERSHLFNKYFRGRATLQPGAGLGLYLVRRIALLHGGDAGLLENFGPWNACFFIVLPTHTTAAFQRGET